MVTQIAIIGLGRIGGSIGRALAEQEEKIYRVGYDKDRGTGKNALKIGAVDKLAKNLPDAVQGVDAVVLALPLDEIKDVLEAIAQTIKPDAVVVDTSTVKKVVAQWVKEFLPETISYVGVVPVINPLYLDVQLRGFDSSRGDLFQRGLMAIAVPPRTDSSAIQMVSELAQMMGSTPFFVDLFELDGLMMKTHTLPQLISAVLLDAIVNQSGWREARKLAGSAYAETTKSIDFLDNPDTLTSLVMHNREDALRVLDYAIESLMTMRDNIEREDKEALHGLLLNARDERRTWWQQRQNGDWLENTQSIGEVPERSSVFRGLFGFGSSRRGNSD